MTINDVIKKTKKAIKNTAVYGTLGASFLFGGCQEYTVLGRPGESPQLIESAFEEKNIACVFLGLEQKINSHLRDHTQLHELTGTAKWKLPLKERYSRVDKIAVLKSIDRFLKDEGFTYAKQDAPFYNGLRTKKLSRRDFAILYSAIGQEAGLPLKLSIGPRDIFVIWDEDGKHDATDKQDILWETTRGKEFTDDTYVKEMRINKANIDNGLFLSSLTKKQEIAIAYTERGKIYLRNAMYELNKANGDDEQASQSLDQSEKDFDEALNWWPKFFNAMAGKATVLSQKDNKTMKHFDAVVDQFPELPDAYLLRAYGQAKQSNLDAAIEDCDRAIKLDSENYHAWITRASMNIKKKDYAAALTDSNNAIMLEPTKFAYLQRAEIKRAMGLRKEADKDLEEASKMNDSK